MTQLGPTGRGSRSTPGGLEAGEIEALAGAAKDGDRDAFERLVLLHQNDIYRMIYFRTHSPMDAEDLTQDVFLKAFRNLSGLNDPSRFRSWLFSIAVNGVRDFHRAKKFRALFSFSLDEDDREQPDIEFHDEPEAVDGIMKREFWDHVGRMADNLSRWEREVFFLRFLDDLNIVEIAEALRKSESTIKTLLYRGIKKFREDGSFLEMLREK